jgi:dipeptidyl aminopeptidase/acylaminoacyl peptidase
MQTSFRRCVLSCRRALLFAGWLVLSQAPLSGQSPTPAAPGPAVRRFSDVTLSPNGDYLAWVGPREDRPGSKTADAVVVLDLRNPSKRRAVSVPGAEPGSAHDLAWSRDSRSVAFLATARTGGITALYIAGSDGTQASLVAKLPGAVSQPRFSPDGSQLALLYSSPSEQANGPLDAAPRDTGAIDTRIDRQHLALVSAKGGALRQVTPADLYVYEFDWAPDGKRLVLSAAQGSGNNNWWVARLYAVTLSGDLREILRPKTQIAQPKWSPDGRTVAFVAGLMSDQGATGGDLWVVPVEGGKPRSLTAGATTSIASFAWKADSRALLAGVWAGGGSAIAEVDADTGGMRNLWSADEWMTNGDGAWVPGVSAAADGHTVAAVRQGFDRPPEIWAGPAGKWSQVTHVNQGLEPTVGKAISMTWKSDSFHVQGWLIHPRVEKPGQSYPLIVEVHGGPAYASGPVWTSSTSQLSTFSNAGYFVLLPNPRGSFGQGEAFTRANVKDFGYGDFRDIMAGVDQVAREYPVDSLRVGITGWSYGGFMTMWAVTQTNRFRAAVAGAGLSNWQSYTGENGISEWMVPYFGATVYQDPAVYARSSPINFITRARTPTLIVVGERDVECPAPQSYEFWRGLQRAGAPTQLVVYANEGHGFENPAHQRDVNARTLQWFNRYLAGEATP